MCRKVIQNRKEAFYKKWKLTVKRLITAFFDGCKEKGPGLKYSHGVLYKVILPSVFPKIRQRHTKVFPLLRWGDRSPHPTAPHCRRHRLRR